MAEAPKQERPKLTLQQRIARQEAALARLKAQAAHRSRKLETREKIIVGGTVVAAMREDPALRAQIVALLRERVTRELDREVIAQWLSPTS